MGVVGESGCGKSTVALAIMCYLGKNGRIVAPAVQGPRHDHHERRGAAPAARLQIAMVYQEPMASLNPSLLIGRQLMEVPLYHEKVTEAEAASGRRCWARSSCPTRSGS